MIIGLIWCSGVDCVSEIWGLKPVDVCKLNRGLCVHILLLCKLNVGLHIRRLLFCKLTVGLYVRRLFMYNIC